MKKQTTSNEVKKMTLIIGVLLVIIFIQGLEFLHFNDKLHTILLTRSKEQIGRVSRYIERSFKIEIEQHINSLKIIESQLRKENNMLSYATAKKLSDIKKFSKFAEIGISDLNGNIIDSNGERYRKVYKKAKELAKQDKVFVSDLIKSGDKKLLFIAVPLRKNGTIYGSVWGKLEVNEVIKDIEFDENAERYFQIIDNDGNYLMLSNNKYVLNKEDMNLWEELKKYNYKNDLNSNEIYKSVQNGESGNFYIEKDGDGRFVNYRSLGINNWYVLSAQVEDKLQSHIKDIRNLVSKFFIIVVLGLLIVFGIIYKIIHKMYEELVDQHHQTETFNAMLQGTLQKTKNVPFIIERKYKKIAIYGYPTKDNMKYYTFDELQADNMIAKDFLDENSREEYKKFYEKVIINKEKSEPIIVNVKLVDKKEWFRVSIISEDENTEEVMGVLEGYNEQKEKDLKIENQLVDIKEIKDKSRIDFLTKLYNREALFEKITEELEKNKINPQLYAFLVLDIDNFKMINDCMGHRMGDTVLRKISEVLNSYFTDESIVGRLGGDEFVIFLKGVKDRKTFEETMRNLNKALCKSYKKNEKEIQVSASIGVVLTDKNININNLYKKADKALYKVKHSGRNGFEIYSDH